MLKSKIHLTRGLKMVKNRMAFVSAPICISALFLIFIAGCSKKESETPAYQTTAKANVYRLRFGHDMPTNSAQHHAAVKFADIVNYKSDGKVEIEVFPTQQLGTDHEMIESAIKGELDIILSPTSKLTGIIPALQILDLPFLFPTREDCYAILDGEPGELLLGQFEGKGLIGVAFWESGFKHFTANKEIRSVDDFIGQKIRVMKSPVIKDQFQAFGANPIPIDFHQTYRALKDKVIDGQENPLGSIVNMKFHEVQSHLILSKHAYLAQVLCLSKKAIDKLPEEIMQMLITTGKDLTLFQRQVAIAREEIFLKSIEESSTQIIKLSESERAAFQNKTKHLLKK